MATITLLMTVAAGLSQVEAQAPCPAPVVLDDFAGAAQSTTWAEGWYTPCGDAYGGHQPVDFHHDNADNKGLVSADYYAQGLTPGCWLVEEHHPGRNPLCARFLPTTAPLTIYGGDGGATATATVNQAVNGGQWNPVGRYMLAGHAHLQLSNRGSTECAAGRDSCYWIADAFRLSWHGPVCDAPASQCEQEANVAVPARQATECDAWVVKTAGLAEACSMQSECGAVMASPFCHEALAEYVSSVDAGHLEHCLGTHGLIFRETIPEAAPDWLDSILACPYTIGDDDDAVQQEFVRSVSRATAVAAGVGDSARLVESMELVDCTGFTTAVMEAYSACGSQQCCTDYLFGRPRCSYLASSLLSRYPHGTFHICLARHRHELPLRCTCAIRKAAACALQSEVHQLLTGTIWQPGSDTCLPDDYAGEEQDEKEGWFEQPETIVVLLLLLLFAAVVGALSYQLFVTRPMQVGVTSTEPTAPAADAKAKATGEVVMAQFVLAQTVCLGGNSLEHEVLEMTGVDAEVAMLEHVEVRVARELEEEVEGAEGAEQESVEEPAAAPVTTTVEEELNEHDIAEP